MRNCHDNIHTRKVIIMFSGDFMAYNNGRQFSTRDRDNDGASSYNCAEEYGMARWWYRPGCGKINLNGVYYHSPRTTDYIGIWWYLCHGRGCGNVNLNGVYYHSPRTTDWTGIWWYLWHGDIGCTAVSTTTHPVPQIGLGFGGIFGMVGAP